MRIRGIVVMGIHVGFDGVEDILPPFSFLFLVTVDFIIYI
jgi:hypothetical protein